MPNTRLIWFAQPGERPCCVTAPDPCPGDEPDLEVCGEAEDVPGALRLVEELERDSLRLFTLAAEIENHFRVSLYEDEEGELATVGDLVDLIRSKIERG